MQGVVVLLPYQMLSRSVGGVEYDFLGVDCSVLRGLNGFGQAARRSLPADFLAKMKKKASKKSVRNVEMREKLTEQWTNGNDSVLEEEGGKVNQEDDDDDGVVSHVLDQRNDI